MVYKLPYFLGYKTYFPLQIWEENGGASYSLNVAYLAHWGVGAVAVEWVFPPVFLL